MVHFIINLLAFIFVVVINFLSNALPFNGQTTSEIANRIDVLFTPAGYVFSIWGLIYLLLFIWILKNRDKFQKATPLFVITCLLNSVWLFLWHYEYFFLSMMIMISLLVSLIFLYKKIKRESSSSFMDFVPFSVYLGWISVATIANISYVLVHYNWDQFGLSDVFWTVFMLFVATIVALTFRIRESDFVFPLVFVWAFIGIGIRTLTISPIVAYSAFILATVIFVGALFGKQKQYYISVF